MFLFYNFFFNGLNNEPRGSDGTVTYRQPESVFTVDADRVDSLKVRMGSY